tara:strand:+ start:891 stop:1322 length:432 start_codon:yes stop_codon:yes gene_type:complete
MSYNPLLDISSAIYKGLEKFNLNQHNELLVNSNTLKTKIISQDSVVPALAIYETLSQELTQSVNPSILLTAPTWTDLTKLEMTILVSNDNEDFHLLHNTFYTVKSADKSKQLFVENFKFKYFKVRVVNTDLTEEAIKSLSYCY